MPHRALQEEAQFKTGLAPQKPYEEHQAAYAQVLTLPVSKLEHSYKLVVSCNRKYHLLHTPETLYVEAGRAVRLKNAGKLSAEDRKFLDSLPFGDDTGENISSRNPEWNEMTVIYWVFKNYEKIGSPEYIGFEHYRRH